MDVNIGYAWGQWMRARRTAAEHPDEAVRARAREKLASWERVMTGMQAGTVEVGSRTATGAPAWVTPEVIHGGFATGQHVAGGPLLECERAIATRLGMVAEGRFREDLFYRLDVFGIRVPALRERKGDLASLVSALVGELSRRLQIEPPPVTRAILARLESHDWPGNVRELANVLETALILGAGRSLELPEDFMQRTRRKAAPAGPPRFESAVRDAIEAALRATRGKLYGTDGAAARLGLKPGTLQSKMKKLGIRREDFVSR